MSVLRVLDASGKGKVTPHQLPNGAMLLIRSGRLTSVTADISEDGSGYVRVERDGKVIAMQLWPTESMA